MNQMRMRVRVQQNVQENECSDKLQTISNKIRRLVNMSNNGTSNIVAESIRNWEAYRKIYVCIRELTLSLSPNFIAEYREKK